MTRRKYPREAEACRCSHVYADHLWGFLDEAQPCDVFMCGCVSFLADGLPVDPDEKHDREAEATL